MADPTHTVWLTDKEDSRSRTQIGVAFADEWGGFAVKLGPGVLIDADARENRYLNLKRYSKPVRSVAGEAPVGEKSAKKSDDAEKDDGDIPF